MVFIMASLAACQDLGIRTPKVFNGIEVPDDTLNEPRVVPVPPPPPEQRVYPRLGDVPSKPKDFTPQPTINATKQEMDEDRSEARQMQENYQETPPMVPDPALQVTAPVSTPKGQGN